MLSRFHCMVIYSHLKAEFNNSKEFFEILTVVELRKDNCRSAPPCSRQENPDDIMGSMSVISLQIPSRAQTAPTGHQKMRGSGKLTL